MFINLYLFPPFHFISVLICFQVFAVVWSYTWVTVGSASWGTAAPCVRLRPLARPQDKSPSPPRPTEHVGDNRYVTRVGPLAIWIPGRAGRPTPFFLSLFLFLLLLFLLLFNLEEICFFSRFFAVQSRRFDHELLFMASASCTMLKLKSNPWKFIDTQLFR